MTIENPKQINFAIYYVDERNEWCTACMKRLCPDGDDTEWSLIPDMRPCTECTAFAAGTHPSLKCLCDGTVDDPADTDCPRHGRPAAFIAGTLDIDQIITHLENMGDSQASIVAEFLSDIPDEDYSPKFVRTCMDEIIAAAQYVKANLK